MQNWALIPLRDVVALALASLTIFIRSCFRVAELQGGFGGKLANQEVTFMILEGGMICIASISLTVLHPGLVFGRYWRMARARVALSEEHVVMADSKNGMSSRVGQV